MNRVNFIVTVQSKYNSLTTKDENTLYFITDGKRIYRGDVDVTESLLVVSAFDETPGSDIIEGKLYVNASTLEVRIKHNNTWVILTPGYVSTGTDFDKEENSGKLATIAATKAYLAQQIADITGGTAFVKDIAWSGESGSLSVDKGSESPTTVQLRGVAHSPSYDVGALKITIPVYGSDDLVINLPKDNFVRSGGYNKEYEFEDGSTGPAVVLIVDDGDAENGVTKEIAIPAKELVDIYTGSTTGTMKVSVSAGNVITADAIIDTTEGNALVVANDGEGNPLGLRVDVSDKAKKVVGGTAGNLVTLSSAGDIADGGVALRLEGEMGSSETEIPVASLIASAITSAVSVAQTALTNQLDLITNSEGTGRLDTVETKLAPLVAGAIGEGEAGKVVLSTANGVVRSSAAIGGATLSETADANTLATESAVADAVSWKTLA